MASTWILKQILRDEGTDEVRVIVQEIIDEAPSDNRYESISVPRNAGAKDAIKADLKTKILADRAKKAQIETVKNSLDMTDFEDFINT